MPVFKHIASGKADEAQASAHGERFDAASGLRPGLTRVTGLRVLWCPTRADSQSAMEGHTTA